MRETRSKRRTTSFLNRFLNVIDELEDIRLRRGLFDGDIMDTELVTDIESSSSENVNSRFLLVLENLLLLSSVFVLPLASELKPD